MPARRPRFHLVDIVLITALVALVVGFLRWMATPRPLGAGDRTALLFCVAFGVWFAVWNASRAKRVGPECVECGRRFVPAGDAAPKSVCPRCRRRALSPAKVRRETAKNLAVLAYLLAFATFLVAVMLYMPGDIPFGPGDWFTLPLMAVGRTLGGPASCSPRSSPSSSLATR